MKKKLFTSLAAAASLIAVLPPFLPEPAGAASGEVLILDTTAPGGTSSVLAGKFVGKTPVVVTPAQWSTMTAAQFDTFDAIVLGDPGCASPGMVAAAAANAAVWSSVVDGNVVILGTDELVHRSMGGDALMAKAAAFAVAKPGKTGAYISLSCYYHGTAPYTPIPLLSGFGSFTARGVGCYNDAHIVGTHPALLTPPPLTDAVLSNWSCSVHEGFDSWPASFEVLAMARAIGTSYTAPDGTVGTPYILARGIDVISDIDLAPPTATNDVGTSHTVTATVTTDTPAPGTPVVGAMVTFKVVAGPHSGTTGSAPTNAAGQASFSYTGTAKGTDTIEATFVDSLGRTQRSNRVESTWVPVEICGNGIDDDSDGMTDEGCNRSPDCSKAAGKASLWPPNHKMVPVSITGLSDADGDPLTVTITSIRQDEPTNTIGDGTTEVDGSGVGTSTAMVRAERIGTPKVPGNGRVYHIGFSVSDGKGGSCTGTVKVGVPHDQGGRSIPADDGPLYDSTTP